MERPTAITIRGIVIAAAWKQNGEITAVDIAGFDEKRYRIADNHMGTQLRMLIKEQIIVDGIIESENNMSVIKIHHFRIDTSDPANVVSSQCD